MWREAGVLCIPCAIRTDTPSDSISELHDPTPSHVVALNCTGPVESGRHPGPAVCCAEKWAPSRRTPKFIYRLSY